MAVEKRTRRKIYYTTSKGQIIARNKGKKESEIQKEVKRQGREIRKALRKKK